MSVRRVIGFQCDHCSTAFRILLPAGAPQIVALALTFAAHARDVHGDEARAIGIERRVLDLSRKP